MRYHGKTGVIEWVGKMGKIGNTAGIFAGPGGSVVIQTGRIVPENWDSARVKITIELLDKELLKDVDAN